MFLFLAINNAIFPLKKPWNVKIEWFLGFLRAQSMYLLFNDDFVNMILNVNCRD